MSEQISEFLARCRSDLERHHQFMKDLEADTGLKFDMGLAESLAVARGL